MRLAEARVDLARRSSGTSSAIIAADVAQPPHVPVEEERLAVVGAERLVDAFAVEKPVIEDGDDGVLLVGHAPVDVDQWQSRSCSVHRGTQCAARC